MPKESAESREERAVNSASPEELEKLAEDEDEYVRSSVAENANTPVSVLEKLAEDEDNLVRETVAGNANTHVSLLEKFAEDENEDVRSSVGWNNNTPVPILEKLAEDESEWVRMMVARNANTPAPILKKLAEDENEDVRKAVAANAPVEKKAGEDDKVTALQRTSLEKTVEKINNWASKAGKPIRCSSDYIVWANEEEVGTFTVKNDKIEGYMVWENESSISLIWELPGSANAAVETLEKNEWSNDEIEYDELEGFEDSEGKASEAFDDKENNIGNYDDFEGGGSTDIVSFGSSYGPSAITITYENQKVVVFESSGGGSWTVKTADGQPETIPNYEEMLKLVRKLLDTPE